MALSIARRRDEPGGVIGLNGPLVVLLCAAYFVLFVCALSYSPSDAGSVRAPVRREGEMTRGCGRQSAGAPRGTGSGVRVVASYALTTMDHEARSRRIDATIGAQ
jgi:hypothetical protein